MQNFGTNFDVNAILKFNEVSPAVQSHLGSVYRQLLIGMAAATIGSYIGSALGAVGSAAGFVSIMCLIAMQCQVRYESWMSLRLPDFRHLHVSAIDPLVHD